MDLDSQSKTLNERNNSPNQSHHSTTTCPLIATLDAPHTLVIRLARFFSLISIRAHSRPTKEKPRYFSPSTQSTVKFQFSQTSYGTEQRSISNPRKYLLPPHIHTTLSSLNPSSPPPPLSAPHPCRPPNHLSLNPSALPPPHPCQSLLENPRLRHRHSPSSTAALPASPPPSLAIRSKISPSLFLISTSGPALSTPGRDARFASPRRTTLATDPALFLRTSSPCRSIPQKLRGLMRGRGCLPTGTNASSVVLYTLVTQIFTRSWGAT